MDPIQGPGPANGVTPPTPRTRSGGGGFSLPAAGAQAKAAQASATADISLTSLLALQEVGDEEVQDREARKRGRDLLAELAALQRDLLAGALGGDRLSRLAGLAADIPPAADPRLRAVMEQISLRARIELARYGAT